MPLMDLVRECKKHDVTVVVDGAHAPGQLELNLEQMGENGVDCFIGELSTHSQRCNLFGIISFYRTKNTHIKWRKFVY